MPGTSRTNGSLPNRFFQNTQKFGIVHITKHKQTLHKHIYRYDAQNVILITVALYFGNNIQTLLNISFLIVTTFTKVVCTTTDLSYHIRSIIIVYRLTHFLKWQTNSFPHTKKPFKCKKNRKIHQDCLLLFLPAYNLRSIGPLIIILILEDSKYSNKRPRLPHFSVSRSSE